MPRRPGHAGGSGLSDCETEVSEASQRQVNFAWSERAISLASGHLNFCSALAFSSPAQGQLAAALSARRGYKRPRLLLLGLFSRFSTECASVSVYFLFTPFPTSSILCVYYSKQVPSFSSFASVVFCFAQASSSKFSI